MRYITINFGRLAYKENKIEWCCSYSDLMFKESSKKQPSCNLRLKNGHVMSCFKQRGMVRILAISMFLLVLFTMLYKRLNNVKPKFFVSRRVIRKTHSSYILVIYQ